MPRPKKEDDNKKIPHKFYVLPSYIPIIKQVIKNLDDNGVAGYLSTTTEKNEKIEDFSIIPEKENVPIKKSSFGIDFNDWVKDHPDKVVNVAEKESIQKDYTAWQSDPLMQDIYNSCLWDASGENQCYPDGVEEYQRRYKDLWARLNEAKRNNKNGACNEIMTEMMERIYNE